MCYIYPRFCYTFVLHPRRLLADIAPLPPAACRRLLRPSGTALLVVGGVSGSLRARGGGVGAGLTGYLASDGPCLRRDPPQSVARDWIASCLCRRLRGWECGSLLVPHFYLYPLIRYSTPPSLSALVASPRVGVLRAAIQDLYLRGYTEQEIAEQVGMPRKTAEGVLARIADLRIPPIPDVFADMRAAEDATEKQKRETSPFRTCTCGGIRTKK